MSGWIRIEKELLTSPRFRRLVRALQKTHESRGVIVTHSVTIRDFVTVETMALGALARLWIYADTHLRDDDILGVTIDEINEIVGVEGFAQCMPADWLQVVDADHVKLPDFLEHNGTSSKERRSAAERQARHRARKREGQLTLDVTAVSRDGHGSNDARPDQTRPDQTRPEGERAPEALDAIAWARWRDYRALIRKPLKPPSIPAAMRKLAGFGEHQAAVVEQSIANGWQGLFELKAQGGGVVSIRRIAKTADELDAEARNRAAG